MFAYRSKKPTSFPGSRTKYLNLLKLALSRNELTNHSSDMNFDSMIFPSVKPQLSMRNASRGWKSASETVHLNKVYIFKWRRRPHSHNSLYTVENLLPYKSACVLMHDCQSLPLSLINLLTVGQSEISYKMFWCVVSLYVFLLVVCIFTRQNTAQLVKIYSDTKHPNI